MKKHELRKEVQNVVIQSPCSVNWNDMDGDQMVRFCGQCKKNVHNLSTLPPKEVASVLQKRKIEPTCVIMRRNSSGQVVFDNCPVFLRASRDRFCAIVANVLLILAWSLAFSAQAQGLNPVPSLANLNDLCSGNFGYDTARDLSRFVTAMSVVAVLIIGIFKKKKTAKQEVREWLALAVIPVLVHLAGTFMINNYGGLGGGGI